MSILVPLADFKLIWPTWHLNIYQGWLMFFVLSESKLKCSYSDIEQKQKLSPRMSIIHNMGIVSLWVKSDMLFPVPPSVYSDERLQICEYSTLPMSLEQMQWRKNTQKYSNAWLLFQIRKLRRIVVRSLELGCLLSFLGLTHRHNFQGVFLLKTVNRPKGFPLKWAC